MLDGIHSGFETILYGLLGQGMCSHLTLGAVGFINGCTDLIGC